MAAGRHAGPAHRRVFDGFSQCAIHDGDNENQNREAQIEAQEGVVCEDHDQSQDAKGGIESHISVSQDSQKEDGSNVPVPGPDPVRVLGQVQLSLGASEEAGGQERAEALVLLPQASRADREGANELSWSPRRITVNQDD